ncbi:MAG: DUF4783 domain-containing protein [Saprospiraceae bacterium]
MNRNNIFLILFILLLAAFFTLWGFNSNSNVSEQNIFGGAEVGLTTFQKRIIHKIRNGNIPKLVEYFDEEVSLTILKKSDFYKKEEAENVLLAFCQNHTAKKFLIKHFGANPTETTFYLIGEMTTTDKEKLRIYISNNKTHIESIEITTPREI